MRRVNPTTKTPLTGTISIISPLYSRLEPHYSRCIQDHCSRLRGFLITKQQVAMYLRTQLMGEEVQQWS